MQLARFISFFVGGVLSLNDYLYGVRLLTFEGYDLHSSSNHYSPNKLYNIRFWHKADVLCVSIR